MEHQKSYVWGQKNRKERSHGKSQKSILYGGGTAGADGRFIRAGRCAVQE